MFLIYHTFCITLPFTIQSDLEWYVAIVCHAHWYDFVDHMNTDQNPHMDLVHYENMPIQYLAIFHGCKNENFQMEKVDIFLIFAQNKDCGYTLELPH